MNAWAWKETLGGSLFLAIFCTGLEWVWAAFIPSHQVSYGIAHGAVMCICIGLVLGHAAGGPARMKPALLWTIVLGTLISASFYPLYFLLGMFAMFVSWILLWLAFAWILRRLRDGDESLKATMIRGGLGSLLSAVGFYPIYYLWMQGKPDGIDYLWFILGWFIAFFPGFAALFAKRDEL